MEEKVYTRYDVDCMMYLTLEILKILDLEKEPIYIDLYCDVIPKIYEDYKQYDDPNKSLLDSINNYIYNNIERIREEIKKAFDGAF